MGLAAPSIPSGLQGLVPQPEDAFQSQGHPPGLSDLSVPKEGCSSRRKHSPCILPSLENLFHRSLSLLVPFHVPKNTLMTHFA